MDKLMGAIALLCFGLFGSAVLLYGVTDLQEKRSFLKTAKTGKGVVKTVGERTVVTGSGNSRSSSNVQYAKVEYQTDSGKTVLFEQLFGLIEGCPEEGAEVPIAYQETDPSKAKIISFASLWAGDALIIVMGLIFISIGVISYKLLTS